MTAKKNIVAKKNITKKSAVKKTPTRKKRNDTLTLPSEYHSMSDYIQTHKTELTESVLDRIKYALKHKLETVEVFTFDNSDYVVTLRGEDFYDNVLNIIDYYLKHEKYELCDGAYKLKNQLEKKYG